jgi:hypothetical protein
VVALDQPYLELLPEQVELVAVVMVVEIIQLLEL